VAFKSQLQLTKTTLSVPMWTIRVYGKSSEMVACCSCTYSSTIVWYVARASWHSRATHLRRKTVRRTPAEFARWHSDKSASTTSE